MRQELKSTKTPKVKELQWCKSTFEKSNMSSHISIIYQTQSGLNTIYLILRGVGENKRASPSFLLIQVANTIWCSAHILAHFPQSTSLMFPIHNLHRHSLLVSEHLGAFPPQTVSSLRAKTVLCPSPRILKTLPFPWQSWVLTNTSQVPWSFSGVHMTRSQRGSQFESFYSGLLHLQWSCHIHMIDLLSIQQMTLLQSGSKITILKKTRLEPQAWRA